MGNVEIPNWLKDLPLAPEYHPTETEFADPIAYISKIEKEASAFGICKVIPPFPKPSKRYVLSNLNKSLSKCPELGGASVKIELEGQRNSGNVQAIFTTRQQELGYNLKTVKGLGTIRHCQVWQSGELYTLEQFESKSKVFARNYLGKSKEVSPLIVETLFWKATSEKPIYIEYANDVPGSGFGQPEKPNYFHKQGRKKKLDNKYKDGISCKEHDDDIITGSHLNANVLVSKHVDKILSSPCHNDGEGTSGLKISNSPWNLQVIARSRGSLTRFMPDDIPGVTSPMVYIGMLFSWFAWHVEDHELHSLNFLHTGAAKTWYAIPGDHAFAFEDVVRVHGYGGHPDPLGSLILLGQKTTLLSPETLLALGIPCCRLVQNPGEFVVTFPRAYHVGFSHGFNCGEAANFATPRWLNIAKEAAIRRAAMNYLPMLSHQQLLYMLTMSFILRVPRGLLPGIRSSRLKDRTKEERENFVKKTFVADIISENRLVHIILQKDVSIQAVLWDPEFLPSSNCPSSLPINDHKDASTHNNLVVPQFEEPFLTNSGRQICSEINVCLMENLLDSSDWVDDDDDFPFKLHRDSGPLTCVACGILGFPFMAVVQPSDRKFQDLFPFKNAFTQVESGSLEDVLVSASTINDYDKFNSEIDAEDPTSGPSTCKTNGNIFPKCEPLLPLIEHDMEGNFTELTSNSGVVEPSFVAQKSGNNEFVYNEIMSVTSSIIEKRTPLSDIVQDLTGKLECLNENNNGDNNVMRGKNNSHGKTQEVGENTTLLDKQRDFSPMPDKTAETISLSEAGTDHNINERWNLSNKFLRPRLFCLEHALEIMDLLVSKGGLNMLIICHSDYTKIKQQSIYIAEEINVSYNCKDIPLRNASEQDFHLIDISIDSEDHEDNIVDWTSSLGINLKHCVKLRKQCPSKQNKHALSLNGIFSDPNKPPYFSNLKWSSRKLRSHLKETGVRHLKVKKCMQLKNPEMCPSNPSDDVSLENQTYARACYEEMLIMGLASKPRGRSRKFEARDSVDCNVAQDNGREGFGVSGSLPKKNFINNSSEMQQELFVKQENQTIDVCGMEKTIVTINEDISKTISSENNIVTNLIVQPFMGKDDGAVVPSVNAIPIDRCCESKCVEPSIEETKMNEVYLSQDNLDKKNESLLGSAKPRIRRNKRRREIEIQTGECSSISNGFVRSPCEGLRPRKLRFVGMSTKQTHKERTTKGLPSSSSTTVPQKDAKQATYSCHMDNCSMSFGTREELDLHKHNVCTYNGCEKRFTSNRNTVNYQVHKEERSFRCTWKGCTMSFKWAWARTEHLQLHIEERPYQFKVSGCRQTFVRQRRKTGHSVR